MDINTLEPNSNKYKQELAKREMETDIPEEHKFEQVVQGKAKKRSLGRRFAQTFLKASGKEVKNYILADVLVPSILDTLFNIITGGASMYFYGDTGGRMAQDPRAGRLGYHKANKEAMGKRDRIQRATTYSYRGADDFDFDDVILESRGDCERILRDMEDAIYTYGQVTVADLYDMIGITNSNFQNYKFGWVDLKTAGYSRLRSGGYVLDLPKVVDLK